MKTLELRTNSMRAEINLHGAELLFLGKNSDSNILWSKQTDHWNRVAPNLFPIVGRLVNDSYTFQWKSYSMSQHGFARDREFEVVEQTENSVRLRLVSDGESIHVYPYFFIFDVCFSLSESGLTISYETQNTGTEPLYYSVGGHPAFHLEESIGNYYLEFDSDVQLEREELVGSYFSGESTYYGVSHHLNLSEELFENDAFVMKNPTFRSVCLKNQDGETLVHMKCDSWTAIGFWTKKDAPFLCIEPWWGWADKVDSSGKLEDKEGIIELKAAEKKSVNYIIEIPSVLK